MRGIINFFLKNAVAANLLMVFLFIIGGSGLLQLKTSFFPETPLKNINIQLVYPGASPEEMEEGIVTKIEENLIGVTGVKRTTSSSSENAASVNVEIQKGYDIDLVIQDVKNAVDQISSFPADLEPPIIYKIDPIVEAYIFSLSGDVDLRTLKKTARDIEDDLLNLDGISKVNVGGFPDEEIEISFRETDMRAMNITFDEAVAAVAKTNLLTTGGTIKAKDEELLIRAKNKEYYAEAFEDIVLRSSTNGGLVKLHEIADVKDQWQDSPVRSFVNGESAVIVTVYSTRAEDMFENSNTTQEYLETFEAANPAFTVSQIRDGKKYLEGRIRFIYKNGAIGFLLVLLLLAMFLNLRLAFWVALAIPISFAGMFLIAAYTGLTINVITTFGMIIVIGILVDDGIVIAENIFQHYERGAKPFEAAINGTIEVLPAVSASILTTVIAFSTFLFIEGRLGDVFSEMAIVISATLIFSLIEGILILPAHIAHSKALKEEPNKIMQFFDGIMSFLKNTLYSPILKFSMSFPIPTFAICIAGMLIVMGALQGGLIQGTFFPNVQSDDFSVTLEMPAGTSDEQVYTILEKIETAALRVNEEFKEEYFGGEGNVIELIQKSIGPNSYQGQLDFYLMDGEERKDVKNRMITNAIKAKLGPIPEADKLIFGLGAIFGDPVSISLLSTNADELINAVDDLKNDLTSISDLTDIQDSNKEGLKEVNIQLKEQAYNLGLTLGDIMRSIRQGFFGAEIQRLQRGTDEVKVWVRYQLDDRSSIADLADMRIRTNSGLAVPLRDLVDFETERGVVAINHIDGQREIRVTADVASDDASVSAINSDIESILLPKILAKYPSVSVGFEGQARNNAESMASMQRVMPMILLCMFFVVILAFSSVSQAMIVFMLIPFSFIGVGLGHWMTSTPISFLSILGVIALIGIFVNDALVFISTFNSKIKRKVDFKTALYETGMSRFRPITLTTITTVAGLLPILTEKSVQAQFLIPMATSVAFGLIFGTFILLALIPALIVMANKIQLTATTLWTGKELTPAMVEPAYPDRERNLLLTVVFALLTLASIGVLVFMVLQVMGKVV